MSTTSTIRAALTELLETTPNLPELIKEGEKYTRTIGTAFVRFKLMPAETINNSIGNNPILSLRGLAQIDVFYPAMRGVDDIEVTAQSIITAMSPRVLVVAGQQIVIDGIWAEGIREDPTFIQLPVVLRWRAFRN